MGIMSNIFGAVPATPAVVAPTAAQAVQPAAPVASANPSLKTVTPSVVPVASPNTSPNGVVPAATTTPAAEPNLPKSPLDPFKELWEPIPIDPNAPKPTEPVDNSLDPAKLQEIVSKANFAQNVTTENLAAIQAGGEAAVAAYKESLNTVAQQTMIQSTLVANKMVESAMAQQTAELESRIPELVRKSATNSSLVDSNPIFSDPAIKPMLDMAQSQLATKFPTATPAELTKMSQDYIVAMGKAFNPEVTPAAQKVPVGENWEMFLTNNQP